MSDISAPMRDLPSSIMPKRVSLPSMKVVAISLARSTSVSLIWRARASSAALSLAVPVSSACARVSNSLIRPWPRSESVRSMLFRLASNSELSVLAAPPSSETMPDVRSSSRSVSDRVRLSVLSVSLAMRVSSRLAKASPEVDRRSVMESTRVIHGIEQVHAAFVDAVDQRVAGIGDRHRQLGRGVQDRVADDVARLTDLVAQRLVRAGDRGANALGMGDHGFALAAQPVDQRADARGVLRIGPLDLVHFGVDEGFKLHGARQACVRCLRPWRQLRGGRPGRPS